MTWLTNLYNRFLAWQRAGRIRREVQEQVYAPLICEQCGWMHPLGVRKCAELSPAMMLADWHRTQFLNPLLTDQDGDTLIGHQEADLLTLVGHSQPDTWPDLIDE